MQDMRTFIEEVRRKDPNNVLEIEKEIDPRYEISALQAKLWADGVNSILIFNNIKGSTYPLVLNLFGTRERMALALGTSESGFLEEYQRRNKKLIPVESISSGPAQEVIYTGQDVDMRLLPIMTAHEADAGPYITAALVMARDPDTGTPNVSFNRLMIVDRNTLYTHLTPGRHLDEYYRRAEAAGKPLEITINIGIHPAWAVGALSMIPIDQDELQVMGALAGEPIRVANARTVGVPILADAEIILEGEILPEVRGMEGPFCEFTRYAIGARLRHVVKVKAITCRRQPIYHGLTCGSPEHHMFGAVAKEASLLAVAQRTVPKVRGLHLLTSGCSRFICAIAIEKNHQGQPQDVAMAVLNADNYAKIAIVVDPDINIYDEQEVWWAVATRVQGDRDIRFVSNCVGSDLDPSCEREGLTCKTIIDATAKPSLAKYPRRACIPTDIWERIRPEEFMMPGGRIKIPRN